MVVTAIVLEKVTGCALKLSGFQFSKAEPIYEELSITLSRYTYTYRRK